MEQMSFTVESSSGVEMFTKHSGAFQWQSSQGWCYLRGRLEPGPSLSLSHSPPSSGLLPGFTGSSGWFTVTVKTGLSAQCRKPLKPEETSHKILTLSGETVPPEFFLHYCKSSRVDQVPRTVLARTGWSFPHVWECRAVLQCGPWLPGGPGARVQGQPPDPAGLHQPSAVWNPGR